MKRHLLSPDSAPSGVVRSALGFFSAFAAFAGRRGLLATLLVGLGAALEGIGLAVLVPLLRGIVDGALDHLPWLMAGFALLVLLRAIVLWHRDVLLATLRIGFVEHQRARLIGRLIEAPWPQLSGMRHAEINHLLSSDLQLTGACVHFMLQGGVSLCLLGIQWGLAFLFSPALTAIVGLLLVGAAMALLPQLAKSRELGQEVAEANVHLATSGAQFLGGLKLAMSQNLQSRFAKEFNETLHRLMLRQADFTREQSKAQLTFTTLSSLAGAAAILLGIWLLDIPPPLLIVFVLLLARMGAPAAQLQQGAQQFANFLPSYEKVKKLESEFRAVAPMVSSAAELPSGPMQFHKVSYRHPDSDKGVFDLDLVIEPGSFIGVTGASGAGKTTFADLLVGLLVPQSGMISLGGRAMSDELRGLWRSTVAYAPQEAFLFHDSIRNNLLWAEPGTRDEDIHAALRLAGAEAFIPDLDKVVGEKGTLLSGGERQRLALARALLRKSPLLVLDETTSAVDISTERVLLERLANLPWRPSIVLIAHRTESLARCDRIIEFAEGRIISGVNE